MRTGVIIQTRMGSTRLPGKVMLDICGKTVIEHIIERLKQMRRIDEIIIATTTKLQDDIIVEQAMKNGIEYYRGSEDNVLARYYFTAKANSLDVILRITSDCPLIDPHICDNIIRYYCDSKYDIVTNASQDLKQRTYPRGLDCECFSFGALEEAFLKADKNYQKEHVTPYIYENSKSIFYYKNSKDFSIYRWTLDTIEDYQMITAIYKEFYKGKHDFYFEDIIKFLEKHPEVHELNMGVEQK